MRRNQACVLRPHLDLLGMGLEESVCLSSRKCSSFAGCPDSNSNSIYRCRMELERNAEAPCNLKAKVILGSGFATRAQLPVRIEEKN